MKNSYCSSYTGTKNLESGTYVKLYNLGTRGLLVSWQYAATTGLVVTTTTTITLTLQNNSTFDLVLPTTFGQGSNLGREFILPLVVKSSTLIVDAGPNL